MSKNNRNSTKLSFQKKPLVETREKMPIAVPTKAGIELRCPFCDDAHVLRPDAESPCGTRVIVTAIQEIVSTKFVRENGIVCIKCHQTGGEMVRYRNSYVHLTNCAPETKLLQEIPEFSRLAGLVYKVNPRVRGMIERFTGRADEVLEIDDAGNKTGKVLGYFFYRREGTPARRKYA